MAGERPAVVVDPLGTGQEYPEAFREAGVDTVAVLAAPASLADPFYAASWRPERFQQVHEFDGDLAGLARTLRELQPRCVIPGAETGVELAEQLVELVLPGTGNAPVPAGAPNPRRDKGAMAEAVRRAGIPHLRQYCGTDPDQIDRWLDRAGLAGSRLVVKPTKSGGTDNVHIVPPGADWRPFFDQIYGEVNLLGVRNDAVMVGEFAEGTEYLIDSYSVDGQHGLVDVCQYTKSQRGDRLGIYELVDFLPPDDPAVGLVWPYVQQVLDAVGIRNGCAHSEVIVTPDGPRFVEAGARPAGGGHQWITKLATGTNQILRTVDHRVRGGFRDRYQLVRYVCSVVINAPRAGIWCNAELFDNVDSLPTFHAKGFDYRTGDLVPAAEGLATVLGWVVLATTDKAAQLRDYRALKELEKQIAVKPAPDSAGEPTPR